MKKHLPNSITCLNLFSGCVGVTFALDGRPDVAAYCVLLSGVFDFFDGLVARALHVRSAVGKELDSLADVVSFGLVPGSVLYYMLGVALPTAEYLPYLGFLVTLFSAIRLAKFNVDERQSTDFIGLNTPMNAFYVVSLPFIGEAYSGSVYHPLFLLGSIVVTSALLVSNIRLFSLKLESLSWRKNRWKFIFIILSAVLVGLFNFAAIPAVLVLYFLFSYIHFKQMA
ncbi:CDP-diacylglycerol--serine O-phosphatidyltransferase [Parapedobacter sp. ISTM3]|uniref:CDP-diacylglycerol--serine O-phosphatidyltransferase n=1 Tax=Parapedobacter luteus TaxID=623280 RepID=A0A1T5BLB9_9SPHI|nr:MULTISPECIES: CDP-diacylglycerol--serine O-phosphatidyltransferase [Parapedobacter]MBK1439438.1 CDP-diacylglycerol--serine O-phosphatidyltransferase [Parapedobacter sp. ISTM3]SKB47760.1 CDP-diacylglycerol---serine O-phosphatidyltransferase [Parapedobacter luteus]